jgi:hypothetical protein
MGNHRMGHFLTRVNSASPKVSKVVVVKIRRQFIGIEVTQPLNVVIPSTRVETITGSIVHLVCGLGIVSTKRN